MLREYLSVKHIYETDIKYIKLSYDKNCIYAGITDKYVCTSLHIYYICFL